MRRIKSLMSKLSSLPTLPRSGGAVPTRLNPLGGFGANPGGLDAFTFIPEGPPTGLVVVLHGCTQSAAAYDQGSGWTLLAERHGFAVLYPQQNRTNNSNLCFNWFELGDARRGRGEAESIAAMVRYVAKRHGLPRDKIFVTGLSAGGAMASVMLAAYPELFAGGAVIAGLPYASANNLPDALARMRGQGSPTRSQLAAAARANLGTSNPPTLSVWHGTHDNLVVPDNADATVDQWRDLHGVGAADGTVDKVAGHKRTRWKDAKGRVLVERYDIQGMGHGTPLHTRDGDACGMAGAHMLETSICSTREIAGSWGLTRTRVGPRKTAANEDRVATGTARAPAYAPTPAKMPGATMPAGGVGAVIEDALRKAGLMR